MDSINEMDFYCIIRVYILKKIPKKDLRKQIIILNDQLLNRPAGIGRSTATDDDLQKCLILSGELYV